MRQRPSFLRGALARLALAGLVGAIGAVVAIATPAQACFVDPDTGQCVLPPPPLTYTVTGADSNGLADMTQPFGKGTNGSAFIKWFPNGTRLQVRCQANNGGMVDGRYMNGHPFTTWDKLGDNTWVYDWYMNTPLVGSDGYSPGIPHCPWSASAAGTYHVTSAPSGGTGIYSEPHLNNVLRLVTNGTALSVVCQVNNGDQLDGKVQYGRPFETWDKLSDGTWIYDWYMDTPLVATDGYSPLMPHCGADTSKRFVALGDSYSSGQGTYNYFDPSPVKCRRSYQTYSYVYADQFTMPSWIGKNYPVILACGGATTAALNGVFNGEPAQLTTGDLGPLTKLVTISIGGNDLNFSGIISDSLKDGGWEGRLNAPGHSAYDQTKSGAYQQADQMQTTLVNAYKAIKTRAPYARIIVVGYPMIFPATVGANPRDCTPTLGITVHMSQEDLDAIRNTTTHFNSVIAGAAASAGVYYFNDSSSWTGHDVCSSSPFANGLMNFNPTHNPPADFESYHPTADGYWRMASDLNNFIAANVH